MRKRRQHTLRFRTITHANLMRFHREENIMKLDKRIARTKVLLQTIIHREMFLILTPRIDTTSESRKEYKTQASVSFKGSTIGETRLLYYIVIKKQKTEQGN